MIRDQWNTYQRISDIRLHDKSIFSSLLTRTWRSSVTTRKRYHVRRVLQASNIVQRWEICTAHPVEVLRIKLYNEVKALQEGRIYVRQNLRDAQIYVTDIQEMIDSGDKQMANWIMRYREGLQESQQYWMARRNELSDLIKQIGHQDLVFYL